LAEPTFSKVQLENPDSPGDYENIDDPGGSGICKERFCEVV